MRYIVNKELEPLYEKRPEPLGGTEKTFSQSDELLYGMSVDSIEEKEGWIYVRTFYGYEGWIEKSALISREYWMEGKRLCVVSGWYADILEEPRIQAARLGSVPRGGFLVWLGDGGVDGWSLVRLWDGRKGFVREAFISPWRGREWRSRSRTAAKEERLLRCQLIETAETYRGVPYRWGGKTIFGMDCSGFCSMVYLLHGIIIYRDAVIRKGYSVREIPLKMAQAGDLLYYPGHMAMYLGSGRYIHSALSADGVTINSLDPKDESYREDLARPQAGTIFI